MTEEQVKHDKEALKDLATNSSEYQEQLSKIQKLELKLKNSKPQRDQLRARLKEVDEVYAGSFEVVDKDVAVSIPRIVQGFVNESQKKSKGYIRRRSWNPIMLREKLERSMYVSCEHLGPNRTHQARLYFKHNQHSEINAIIGSYSETQGQRGAAAHRFLTKWLKALEIGQDVKVKTIEGVASMVEVQQFDGRWINLADKGFGAGQVLTILLEIANIINSKEHHRMKIRRYPVRPIILIEEPETNLHPYLQSKLAELFYEANREFGIQFIIETHSEYLVRKTQAIVKETQDLNAFKVYYFDKEKGIYPMRYREDGKFMDEFGEGFFDEASKLAFKLF